MDRHFTATAFIADGSRVLFLSHKKHGIWLPPGGHVEANELPHETVLREIREETGLDVDLVLEEGHEQNRELLKDDPRARVAPGPWKVLLEKIGKDHYHIDLLYLAKAKGNQKPSGEEHEFRWFNQKELEQTSEIIPNAKHFAILAIKEIAKRQKQTG